MVRIPKQLGNLALPTWRTFPRSIHQRKKSSGRLHMPTRQLNNIMPKRKTIWVVCFNFVIDMELLSDYLDFWPVQLLQMMLLAKIKSLQKCMACDQDGSAKCRVVKNAKGLISGYQLCKQKRKQYTAL